MNDSPWSQFSLVLAALILALCLAGCSSIPPEAISHAQKQARNAYGLQRAATSDEGQAIATMELEAWRRQHLILTGEDVPPIDGVFLPPLPVLAPPSGQ